LSRIDSRTLDQLREIKIVPGVMPLAEGSVEITFGKTKLICTATVEEKVPVWIKGSGKGWITAEYSMLPRSSGDRIRRERTKIGGRTAEIQRLIGRSLRAIVDLKKLGERSIILDADVIWADGGTRTAAITGCFVALQQAINTLLSNSQIKENPIKENIAAVSVGLVDDKAMLDLCYEEDSSAQVDMNIVMTESERYVEIQGTAENDPFTKKQRDELMELGWKGIKELIELQKSVLVPA